MQEEYDHIWYICALYTVPRIGTRFVLNRDWLAQSDLILVPRRGIVIIVRL